MVYSLKEGVGLNSGMLVRWEVVETKNNAVGGRPYPLHLQGADIARTIDTCGCG